MSELKPCPFCGNRAYLFSVDEEGCCINEDEADAWAVRCGKCSARMCEMIKEVVIDEWNRRVNP